MPLSLHGEPLSRRLPAHERVSLLIVESPPCSSVRTVVRNHPCKPTMIPSILSPTLLSLALPSSTSCLNIRFSSFSLLASLSASSLPKTARFKAASLSLLLCAASLLRLLNCATLPWTSELPRECVMKGSLCKCEICGRDGECGSCCRFARSGDTGNSGVPGEAGNLKIGSISLEFSTHSDRALGDQRAMPELLKSSWLPGHKTISP